MVTREQWHSLLARQLKRHGEAHDSIPPGLMPLLRAVDEAYRQADDDRLLLERSLELTSQELGQRNQQLKTDLARRKLAEENLRKSEAQFRTIAEASPMGVVMTGMAGECLYSNRAYHHMSGLGFDEVLGLGWLTTIHPEDRKRVATIWQEAVAQGQPCQHTYRFLRRDHTVVWVTMKAAAVKTEGTLTGFVAIVDDITDKKRLQEELAAKLKDLQVLNNVMMGREERILELKTQVKMLEERAPHHTQENGPAVRQD